MELNLQYANKDASEDQLANYCEFYREKFPLAFQNPAESDTKWLSPVYEKAFKDYDQKMLKIKNEKNPVSLLQAILALKAQIAELPISFKKSECTI